MHPEFSAQLNRRLSVLALGMAAAIVFAVVLYDRDGIGAIEIAAGWVLMVGSIGLLGLVLRDRMLASLGVLVVAVWSLYHGVSGVLGVLFPEGAGYRRTAGVADWAAARATLYAGLGIAVLTLTYLGACGRRRGLAPDATCSQEIAACFARVGPRLLLGWTTLAILYQSGINMRLTAVPQVAYWADAFTTYVFLPLVVLAVLRMRLAVRDGQMRPKRAVAAGCVIALAMTFLVTRRQDVLVVALAALVLAAKWRLGLPSRRAMLVGACTLLGLFVALAMLRAAVGRGNLTQTTLADRVHFIMLGITEGATESTVREAGLATAATDAGYRLDGNAFLAAMIQARTVEHDGLDLTPFRIVASLTIPSALWPEKLAQDVKYRNPKTYLALTNHLGHADYLVTPLALVFACGGLAFMLAMMALMGVGLGWLDRVITRRASLLTIAIASCAAVALGHAERDITVWGLALRNVVIFALVFTGARVRIAPVRRATSPA